MIRSIVIIVALAGLSGCGHTPTREFPCGPKVLIFTATWCKFCPTPGQINHLQTQYPDYEFVSVDVDEQPDVKAKYRVKRLPTFILCGERGCWTTNSLEQLKKWLREYQ